MWENLNFAVYFLRANKPLDRSPITHRRYKRCEIGYRGHFPSTACCTKSNLLNFMQHKTVESKHYLHDRSRNFCQERECRVRGTIHATYLLDRSRNALSLLTEVPASILNSVLCTYEINSVDRKRLNNGTRMQRFHLGRLRVYISDTNISCD